VHDRGKSAVRIHDHDEISAPDHALDITAEGKLARDGTADRKLAHDGTADGKLAHDGTADRKLAHDGRADGMLAHEGTADRKLAHDGRAYRELSLWFDQLAAAGDPLRARPRLEGNTEADVCIVGAGLTGLWTAYYLLRAQPSLRVVVLEAQIAGFGASGRNGGWCSSLFPLSIRALARRYGREQALTMRRAMNHTVDEVGAAVAAEGIDCHWSKGGTVNLARTDVQLDRIRAEVEIDADADGVDGYTLLSAAEAVERVGASGVLGASYTPHCARVQPALLVRGLARAVERLGGTIFEHTPAMEIRPRIGVAGDPCVATERGIVRARQVIRATEAWTSTLPGSERDVAPVYSLMVATEPLPASFWDGDGASLGAGLANGETFSDARHLIIYGQRTADNRLAFGGRGAPYHYGSRIDPAFDRSDQVFSTLRETLTELFPGLREHSFSHGWGGPLGIARDWHASVGLNPETGVGWAGGYVGDGVGTTNLAGRTLTDLVLGRDTELTRLPWVGHQSRRWEPEPLRWLEMTAGLRAMATADAEERLTGRASVAARLMSPFLGH
jgi:glycine/D-amino acid oxidase-like deaminating enzyme